MTAKWMTTASGGFVTIERSKPISESREPDVGDGVPRQQGTCTLFEIPV